MVLGVLERSDFFFRRGREAVWAVLGPILGRFKGGLGSHFRAILSSFSGIVFEAVLEAILEPIWRNFSGQVGD